MADDAIDRSLETDVAAALLREDQRESADYLELLATQLEGALPGRAKVERKGGLFSRVKRVVRIAVPFGDAHYEIERAGAGIVARRRKVVRGVALSTHELGLAEWTAELAREIRDLASASAEARSALEKFVMGR